MRQKQLVPKIDQKCVCGHSYAAHYHIGVHNGESVPACAEPNCCDRFRPSEAFVVLSGTPAPQE